VVAADVVEQVAWPGLAIAVYPVTPVTSPGAAQCAEICETPAAATTWLGAGVGALTVNDFDACAAASLRPRTIRATARERIALAAVGSRRRLAAVLRSAGSARAEPDPRAAAPANAA
jgi:hypothetical protein